MLIKKLLVIYKIALIDFYFASGISLISEIIDLAIERKIINKSGTWYSYENLKLGQGKENLKQYLDKNPDILEKIKLAI